MVWIFTTYHWLPLVFKIQQVNSPTISQFRTTLSKWCISLSVVSVDPGDEPIILGFYLTFKPSSYTAKLSPALGSSLNPVLILQPFVETPSSLCKMFLELLCCLLVSYFTWNELCFCWRSLSECANPIVEVIFSTKESNIPFTFFSSKLNDHFLTLLILV